MPTARAGLHQVTRSLAGVMYEGCANAIISSHPTTMLGDAKRMATLALIGVTQAGKAWALTRCKLFASETGASLPAGEGQSRPISCPVHSDLIATTQSMIQYLVLFTYENCKYQRMVMHHASPAPVVAAAPPSGPLH